MQFDTIQVFKLENGVKIQENKINSMNSNQK